MNRTQADRAPLPGDRFLHKYFLKPDAQPPYTEESRDTYVITAVVKGWAYYTTAYMYDWGSRNGSWKSALDTLSNHVLQWLPVNGMNEEPDIPRFGAEEET